MNIIITGASRGIGFETARLLASNPANIVFAIARGREGLDRLSESISKHAGGGKLFTLSFDLVKGDIIHSLLPEIIPVMPHADVLINNAGLMINKPIHDFHKDDFDNLFSANVKGPFFLIQALLPLFSEGAHVINIGSMGGYQGSVKFKGLSLYSASKGALAIISECLAEELKEQKIFVNCLAIGSAQTEMLSEAFPGYQAPLSAGDMARFVADFAVSGHKWFNGKVLPVALTTP